MITKTRFNLSILLLSSLLVSTVSVAQTPQEKGLAIFKEADSRDKGWGDSQNTMTMILRNSAGKESKRQVRARTLEVNGDGDKSINIFDHPADVKGTSFLSHTHVGKPDDQWLYLPALKRVKRISSSNKSGPFMGSEFAYEDIGSQEIDNYTYTFLADEELNGQMMFKVESIPTYKKSGYTKQIVWVDQEEYRVFKTEYYDRKGALLKTLTFNDYQLYLDKYWRANSMSMINHQNGKSTDLVFGEYKFANGYSEKDFNQASLKRAR